MRYCADELLAAGHVVIATSCDLRRGMAGTPKRLRPGRCGPEPVTMAAFAGVAADVSCCMPVTRRSCAKRLTVYLAGAVIGLVGG